MYLKGLRPHGVIKASIQKDTLRQNAKYSKEITPHCSQTVSYLKDLPHIAAERQVFLWTMNSYGHHITADIKHSKRFIAHCNNEASILKDLSHIEAGLQVNDFTHNAA